MQLIPLRKPPSVDLFWEIKA